MKRQSSSPSLRRWWFALFRRMGWLLRSSELWARGFTFLGRRGRLGRLSLPSGVSGQPQHLAKPPACSRSTAVVGGALSRLRAVSECAGKRQAPPPRQGQCESSAHPGLPPTLAHGSLAWLHLAMYMMWCLSFSLCSQQVEMGVCLEVMCPW